MLTISLIRHGKTAGNLRGAFMGSQDHPLDPAGLAELTALPYTLPRVQAVYTSPMKRCTETAAILYPEHAPIVVNDLRERCFGEFEGKTHAEIIAIPGYGGWGMNADGMDFPGGEGKDAFFERVTAAFRETAALSGAANCKAISLVIHGGVIMALMAELCLPRRDYFDWHCQNGGGYLVRWDGEHLTLLCDFSPEAGKSRDKSSRE